MICVDYFLLSHQVVFPLHILHHGIELLVIARVVESYPMKYLRTVRYRPSSLHLDRSIAYPHASKSTLKSYYNFSNARTNASLIYFFLNRQRPCINPIPTWNYCTCYYGVEKCCIYCNDIKIIMMLSQNNPLLILLQNVSSFEFIAIITIDIITLLLIIVI